MISTQLNVLLRLHELYDGKYYLIKMGINAHIHVASLSILVFHN